ncbi:MAG: prepilin-type N-terminal cleavage/methylation domain-containing protein [Microgenomates group bacterium]
MVTKRETGFTLIELIVVITIIAVLTAVTMVSFGGTNKRARDSRRMSDLQKMAVALELARQVGGTYPASADTLVPSYLQALPTDPKTYDYLYSSTNYTYTISAYMEDLGSTNISPAGSCGTVTCNYRITNP